MLTVEREGEENADEGDAGLATNQNTSKTPVPAPRKKPGDQSGGIPRKKRCGLVIGID